jgi:hypothetical protein
MLFKCSFAAVAQVDNAAICKNTQENTAVTNILSCNVNDRMQKEVFKNAMSYLLFLHQFDRHSLLSAIAV